LCSTGQLYAQLSQFNTLPDAFIVTFLKELNDTRMSEAKELASQLDKQWKDGSIGDEEKETFITHVNTMVSKKYGMYPEITHYAKAFSLVKRQDTYVKLQPKEFFSVTQECINVLEIKRLRSYLANLCEYIPNGYTCKRQKYYWQATQEMPRLSMLELRDNANKKYVAPVIKFRNTDLRFISTLPADSTFIKKTSGDYNLLTKDYIGINGQVDWDKMEIPNASCSFNKLHLNFNIGMVSADSVTFNYPSVLSRPMIGRFEDRNIGYKDINKANYPYFKSYGGGVVIENLIPNVRYEGGFSLRGVRKIGSSYDTLVKYTAKEPRIVPVKKKKSTVVPNPKLPEIQDKEEEKIEDIYSDFGMEEFATSEDKGEEMAIQWEVDPSYSGASDSEVIPEGGSAVEENGETKTESGMTGAKPINNPWDTPTYGTPDKIVKKIFAKAEFSKDGKVAVKCQGDEFVLDKKALVAPTVQVEIYLGENDTLSHPGIDLIYDVSDRKMTLKRATKGLHARQPFISTYHDFYLYFESIVWAMDKDELEFTAFIDKENKISAIESFDYFNQSRFDGVKNILSYHPLGMIYRFALDEKMVNTPITPENIVKNYLKPGDLEGFKKALPDMESSGYIRYDKKTLEITPLQKLFTWTKAARKKKDFDAIQVASKVTAGNHATMSFKDKQINMKGVQPFVLSDTQFVRVLPLDQEVNVGKNRNYSFGGSMAAGKMNFYSSGKDKLQFDYESYNVFCDVIDSMKFILVRNVGLDYEFSPLQTALRSTVFEHIVGKIHIDNPDNKSGEKRYPAFPVFDSYEKAYVYWEKSTVQDKIYLKDKLFFQLDPFVMDSLDNFDERALRFDGSFFTSDIFPKFRQTLVVMPDNTLGLKHVTEDDGLPLYKDKGRFYNEINMDGLGLHANGKIEYIGSFALADTFLFHFDSVMAVAKVFELKRETRNGAFFPAIHGDTVVYRWYVPNDRLEISSTQSPIKIFGEEGTFVGKIIITPKGVWGKGTITVGTIAITSDSIILNENSFSCDKSTFVVLDPLDPKLKHFIAEQVSTKYDVGKKEANFETKEAGKTKAFFPIQQYKTSLTKGFYSEAKTELKLEGMSSVVQDNYFLSVDKKMDSLQFTATTSYYEVKKQNIHVSGVPNIIVADAFIVPDSAKVTIERDGVMRNLRNAIIYANQETHYDTLYEATVNIASRMNYTGSGKLKYISINGKREEIFFKDLKVNKVGTTTGKGTISDTDDFYLTERIRFRGDVDMEVDKKFLTFKGEVKIESDNPVFKGVWLTFPQSTVNPDSVYIPIEDPESPDGEELTAGLNFMPEYKMFYSNFLQPKKNAEDRLILRAQGGLTFDRSKQEFRIGPKDKLTGKSYLGNTTSFNDKDYIITSNGYYLFPYKFNKNAARVKMSGAWKEDVRRRSTTTNLLMAIDFMEAIPPEPIKLLIEQLAFLTATKKDVNFQDKQLLENVSAIADYGKAKDEKARLFEQKIQELVPADVKLDEFVPATILLSNVNFKVNNDANELYADTEVGLLSISGQPLNKMMPCRIVYKFAREDGELTDINPVDKLTILMETDANNYVFIEYDGYAIRFMTPFYDAVNEPMRIALEKKKAKENELHCVLGSNDDVVKFRKEFDEKYKKK
jgi:hypothetical protein